VNHPCARRSGAGPLLTTILALCLVLAVVLAGVWFSSGASPAPRPIDVATTRQLGDLKRQEARQPSVEVSATVETDPVPHKGDAADDPAIWVHPTDRSQSTIIGADKEGGLAVYDLAGKQLQYRADGRLNNVDLRYGFPLGGEAVDLVIAANRSTNGIAAYRVNPATRLLENVPLHEVGAGIGVYGSCMYRSLATGKYYTFVTSKEGLVEQWELLEDATGQLDARTVRTLAVGGQAEGCIADDELGHLYVAEEQVGIWKYGAEPEAGAGRTQVDSTRAGGHLTADVEGLALYYANDGTGYLIASSQGNNSFVAYQREGDNAFVTAFRISAGVGIDGVSGTDGLDVTNASLGPAFPNGVLVAQDDRNDGDNQNFKLVPWDAIASAQLPALRVDTAWDPRRVPAPRISSSPIGKENSGVTGVSVQSSADP
jgi:3-phytase